MSIQSLSLLDNNSQIFLSNLCTKIIALLQISSFEILWKNLFLKNLSNPQLSSSFHLKAFKLFNLILEVKDNISFLQHLGGMFLDIQGVRFLFLFSCGYHHGLIGAIDFKEYGHLFTCAVFPFFTVLDPLVLVIGVFVVDQVVQDVTWVGQLKGFS